MLPRLQRLFQPRHTTPQSNPCDSLWQGDLLTGDKPDNTTRVLFHNVRGINCDPTSSCGLDILTHDQHYLDVDIQGISEHLLDTNKLTVTNQLESQLRRDYPNQSTLQIDSSPSTAVHDYKPGGTALVALGNIVGRLEPSGKGGDRLGRWSFMHFRRKNLPPLTIMSVYQVCTTPTNKQGNTAWHQQRRALDMDGRTNLHPRQAFITDLIKAIQTFQQQGHDIIVGGDFNETMLDPKSGLLRLATETNLSDPWQHRHPHHETFNTQISGSKRIDSVLMSHRLMNSVRGIGYAPFGHITNSDHRPMLIDFDTKRLFGDDTTMIFPPQFRGVKANDAASVTTYVEKLHKHLKSNGAFALQKLLDEDISHNRTVELADKILGDGCTIADKACKRRRPEFYSTALAQQRIKVGALRARLQDLKHQRQDRRSAIQARIARAGFEYTLPATLAEIQAQLRTEEAKLRTFQNTSAQLRRREILAKIDVATKTHDPTTAKVLRKINRQEEGCKTYRILEAMRRQKGTTQQLDRIEIPASWPAPHSTMDTNHPLENPKDCTEWTTITDPTDIDYYLTLRNRLHFGQAQGTPFTEEPLRSDVDWAASTEEADAILAGDYIGSHDTPQCQAVLDACRAAAELDTIPAELTQEDFSGKIKAWKESTSTSPVSGRHLGQYKALYAKSKYCPVKQAFEHSRLIRQQTDIIKYILSTINWALRHSYVLERWKTIVNVMIFKDPGVFKIHRLRVIHLYEADFNLVLAVKWRQLLHSADAAGLLNPGQFGGRPGCEAQSLTLLEELKYDISYLTRRILFNFDNDAMSCYDRIIIALASLISRKYGQNRQVVAVHAHTLEEARYRLRRALHLSETEYSHCLQFPLYGSGQGSGNSPSIWIFISSTLFDVHAAQAHGSSFYSPDGSESIRLTMVGFVDDSTGSCNDFQAQTQASVEVIGHRMQHDAQLWNDLLHVSGGGLELTKCSFHVLHFKFSPSGQPKVVLEAFDDRIRVRASTTGADIKITALRADQPHKTLGHHKAPAERNQKTQLSAILAKAKTTSVLIGTSPITRHGATLAYHSVFLPIIKYPLPQSFFSKAALDKTQRSVMGIIIAKCGYNRHTALPLLYAPTSYAGGGFIHWYTLQGEGQIQHVLKHWRTSTTISKAMRIDLAWSQWQAGISTPILEDTNTPLPYLECRWLRSTRDFLRQLGGQIRVDKTFVQLPERQGDSHIMDHARLSGNFDNSALQILNYCRLFLHVTTISELFDAEGTTILPDMFACSRSPWLDPTTIITIQIKPSYYQIRRHWQRFCRHISTADGKIAASISLGPWIQPATHLRLRRSSYTVYSTWTLLYHWKQDCYWEYHPTSKDATEYIPIKATTWTPNDSAHPVSVFPTLDNHLRLHTSAAHLRFRPPPRSPLFHYDFSDYISTLPLWERDLLEHVKFLQSPEEMLEHLSTIPPTRILAVSDGSQQGDQMSFGWVFGTATGTVLAKDYGPAFGIGTSHRGEAWGMLSCACFIKHIQIYTHQQLPPQHTYVSLSDNAGLIKRVQLRRTWKITYANATLAPDWDVTEQIHTTFQHAQLTSHHYEWIKGHQDDHSLYHALPVAAQYNVQADHLAEEYMRDHGKPRMSSPLLPACGCLLQIGPITHQGHYTKIIREAASVPSLIEYLQRKHNWTASVPSDVKWAHFQQAANNYDQTDNHLLKLVYNQLPTQKHKSLSASWVTPTCRMCDQPETFDHLMQCANPRATLFRHTITNAVRHHCNKHNAPRNFTSMYVRAISNWLANLPPLQTTDTPVSFHPVIAAQSKIGWPLLIRGFLTRGWTKYLRDESSRRPQHTHPTKEIEPKAFLTALIKVQWTCMSTFWLDHCNYIHRKDHPGPSPPKLAEIKQKIRTLHGRKNDLLAAHRDEYFPADLETFLTTSTYTQLRTYLLNYEPAIYDSIKKAKKLSSSSVLQFGFTRITQPRPSTRPITTNVSRETPSHRKHSRWRDVSGVADRFRNYFTHTPPP